MKTEIYIEKRPSKIYYAICAIENSGTNIWDITSYDAFARSVGKDVWVVKTDDIVCGVVMIEHAETGIVISLLAKKNFNPKTFLMAWEKIKSTHIQTNPSNTYRNPQMSMEIQNPKLQRLALRLGFKNIQNKFIFS